MILQKKKSPQNVENKAILFIRTHEFLGKAGFAGLFVWPNYSGRL